jgi:hypothetical protein
MRAVEQTKLGPVWKQCTRVSSVTVLDAHCSHVQSLALASHRRRLPVLSSLAEELSKFAYVYLRRSLNIPLPSDLHGRPSVEELNTVLINHLHERSGQHIRVWYTLDIKSDLCTGVQRVRCNPFKSRNDKPVAGISRSTWQRNLPRNTQARALLALIWQMRRIDVCYCMEELSSFFAAPSRILAVACSR